MATVADNGDRRHQRADTCGQHVGPARAHALPAPYRAATTGLPTLADPRHDSAGIDILVPSKQPPGGQQVDLNARIPNALRRSVLFLRERGFALLTVSWRILQHIIASPCKISAIARAALVLNHFEYGRIT
jgi:hypothetical protein